MEDCCLAPLCSPKPSTWLVNSTLPSGVLMCLCVHHMCSAMLETDLVACVLRGRGCSGEEPQGLQRFLGQVTFSGLSVPTCKMGAYNRPTAHPHWSKGSEAVPRPGHPQCSVPPSQASPEAEVAKPTTEPRSLGHRSQQLIWALILGISLVNDLMADSGGKLQST